ncbi:hypothetical protein J6590_066720 [Homalodisca vitripennis]|nr:hypothetical protein J6590_066720 [Homalodisca vitripennis]
MEIPLQCYILKKKYKACPFIKPRPLMVDDSLSSQLEPNLSPQFQHVPVPAPDLQNMSANVHILLQYTTAQGWSNPEYKVFARKPKGEPKRFGAKVKTTRLKCLTVTWLTAEFEFKRIFH